MNRPRPLWHLIAGGAILVLLAFAVRAVAPPPASRFHAGMRRATIAEAQAAQATITAQLEAFKRDDFQRAAAYQSRELQANFATVSEFRAMMEGAYPQFANYARIAFGPALATPDGQRVQILVTIAGEDGVTVDAAYGLVREGGMFKVEGVQGGLSPELPGGEPAPPSRTI